METLGAKLKGIRLAKGLSLEDVHKNTRIHMNILKAIEEDNLTGINPVFIKGFLRMYCRCLGVDANEHIAAYEKPAGKSAPTQAVRTEDKTLGRESLKLGTIPGVSLSVKKILLISVVLVVALGIVFGVSRIFSNKHKKSFVKEKLYPNLYQKKQNVQPKAAPAKPYVFVPPAGMKDNRPAVVVAPVKKPEFEYLRLGILARDNCWVTVRADGRTVFRSIIKKGNFESWQAKERIELSLGNAGVVEIDLNGKAIPPLGKRGQVVKNIFITKEEGLVVKR